MSRGLGDFQRAMLTVVADAAPRAVTTTFIADQTHAADSQVRRAVHVLARGGHLTVDAASSPLSIWLHDTGGKKPGTVSYERPRQSRPQRGPSEDAIRNGWR